MTPAELRELRKRLGMTQAQLADAIGVDRVSVARYETGTRRISRLVENAARKLEITAAAP